MVTALVLAAGVGSRMNSATPKQFMQLNNKEVICYSLDVFQADSNVKDIILVTGDSYIEFCRENIVEKYGYTKVRSIIPGGRERYDSVYNGIIEAEKLLAAENIAVQGATTGSGTGTDDNEKNIIMIHDGARPFVTHRMISDSVSCIENGFSGCTVGMPVKDTIKIVQNSKDYIIGKETPERATLYQIQTPQTFVLEKLHQAYDTMLSTDSHNITDDTMLMEQYLGQPCAVIPGSYDNIKITTPEDILISEIIAKKQSDFA
jgi:2-C-methyl-D-erythritol 4-phosphate cytidylyltransferase